MWCVQQWSNSTHHNNNNTKTNNDNNTQTFEMQKQKLQMQKLGQAGLLLLIQILLLHEEELQTILQLLLPITLGQVTYL